MEYISPRDKLIDLIKEYQTCHTVSEVQAITEMRKILQAKKKTVQAIQAGTLNPSHIGKYQTI
jgi:hypothetical protein